MNKYLLYPTADTMLQPIQNVDVSIISPVFPLSHCPETKYGGSPLNYTPPYIPALHVIVCAGVGS